jgi:hypothetical protein
MSHAWLYEVLDDLLDYARRNHFTRLARQIEITRDVARDELDGADTGQTTAPEDKRGGKG